MGPKEREIKRRLRVLENVVRSFSDIKYFFECAYQFKLRIIYGFNAPLHEALGFGKLPDSMQTGAGRAEAFRRVEVPQDILSELGREAGATG